MIQQYENKAAQVPENTAAAQVPNVKYEMEMCPKCGAQRAGIDEGTYFFRCGSAYNGGICIQSCK